MINAPLAFDNFNTDIFDKDSENPFVGNKKENFEDNFLKDKEVICVLTSSKYCTKNFDTIEDLQKEYLRVKGKENIKDFIVVNTADRFIGFDSFIFDKELYRNLSLIAPFLAAAKEGYLIVLNEIDDVETSEGIISLIDKVDIKIKKEIEPFKEYFTYDTEFIPGYINNKFLVIFGSSFVIPHSFNKYTKKLPYELTRFVGDFDSKLRIDLENQYGNFIAENPEEDIPEFFLGTC